MADEEAAAAVTFWAWNASRRCFFAAARVSGALAGATATTARVGTSANGALTGVSAFTAAGFELTWCTGAGSWRGATTSSTACRVDRRRGDHRGRRDRRDRRRDLRRRR